MVLIDDTLHHINTVMGNQFIVSLLFYVCGGNPMVLLSSFFLKTVPDKKIVPNLPEAYFLVKTLF
jgi:hypothetical protein